MKQDCWQQAVQDELEALQQNHIWDIIPCPSHIKPIDCKWIDSVKLKSDGSLDCYKARLVALGNHQDIDYDEMFAVPQK